MNYSRYTIKNSAIASTNSKNTVEPRGFATTIPATIRTIIPRPIVPHLDDPGAGLKIPIKILSIPTNIKTMPSI